MVFDARFDIESLRVMNDSTMAAFHGMTKLAASHVARTTPHMYAYAHLVDRGSAMIACRRNCATNRLGRVRNPKSDSLATPTEGPQKQRQGKSESDSPSPSRSRGGRGGFPWDCRDRIWCEVLMKSEIPSPKSDLALCVRKSRSKSGIPKSEVRDRTQSPTSPRDPQVRRPRWALRSKQEVPQSQIQKSLVQLRPREISPEESPKSEVRRRSQESEKAVRRGAPPSNEPNEIRPD